MTYRILVTGSRYWADRNAIAQALIEARDSARTTGAHRLVLVHGAARGADSIAAHYARMWGWLIEPHPADWSLHGKAAGHRRNAEMVRAGADICLAFPLGESRGTRGCMALAEKAGIPVIVHEGAPVT
jgi:hypothetical protein